MRFRHSFPDMPSDTANATHGNPPSLQDILRSLPAVGSVVHALREIGGRPSEAEGELLTYLVRRELATLRELLRQGSDSPPSTDLEAVTARVVEALERWDGDSSTCRLINGTGIILHSGLGRAVLAEEVCEALGRARGYQLLEVDRTEGRRRKRDAFLEELLVHLTGAEAALVVNNNAAATILLLAALASGKDVLVSRSQMVEIGGSFRLPDVMEASGCRLKEVGTTNRSYPHDYERAIDTESGALMLVHTSNYRLVGFTEHVGIAEMVAIGRRTGLPVIHDLGSGCLIDPSRLPVEDEPPVQASVRAGADVICFSGDKLIGGVQSGILVGKRATIERIRRHPLARAMRIDKLTCIALETTLKLYLEPSKLEQRLPTLRMLRQEPAVIRRRARRLATRIRQTLTRVAGPEAPQDLAEVTVAEATSEVGAGALPAVGIATHCVVVRPAQSSAEALARRLRQRTVPIFGRIRDQALWIDLRTLQAGEGREVAAALGEELGSDP